MSSRFYVLVYFLSIFYKLHEVTGYGELRIDFEYSYFPHQNIIKAFNESEKQWLYGITYDSALTNVRKCIYFHTESLSSKQVNFTSHYVIGDTPGSANLYGTFYTDHGTTSSPNDKKRQSPNSVTVREGSGSRQPINYTLIYSNYQNCSIFRVRSETEGHNCLVLLTTSTVRSGMPYYCKTMYKNACGEHSLRKVFQDTCKTDESVTGC